MNIITHFRRILISIFFLLISGFYLHLNGQEVRGTVTDEKGNPLAYASIYIKNGTKGTTSNNDGKYRLEPGAGTHTIVCAYIGYTKVERNITLAAGEVRMVDFSLSEIQVELNEVVVRSGAEDPAYAIMRKAIASRKEHLNEVGELQAMVYMKGMIRSLKIPKRVLGQKVAVNNDVIDSSGKGIIYFSESLTKYFKKNGGEVKEEVVSAKVSGNSRGFGFNSPKDLDVNLYENNLSLQGMNSRGFVSPLNDNALHYYRYKFLGSFFEDGIEINKIAVFPKRAYEPLFAGGYINIIEGTWRLHSLQLNLSKESQIEVVDSLTITQEMMPQEGGVWLPRYTRIQAGFGVLGFNFAADFASVYSEYDLRNMPAVFWKDRIVKSIDTSANKKTMAYWDSLRPIPLSVEEQADYVKKDSLEKKFQDPKYLDSLDRIANKLRPLSLLIGEQTFFNRKKRSRWTVPGLLNSLQYNTVEQWAIAVEPTYRKFTDTGALFIAPRIRYNTGFNRLYADVSITKRMGLDYMKRWDLTLAGGRYMFQINPDNPIQSLNNTISTLLYTRNYMKMYEKSYGRVAARKVLGKGFTLTMQTAFEERRPLENTDTSYKWRTYDDRRFTSNYPEELPEGYFDKHQAFLTGITLRYQPGIRYIQYPTRLVSMGSDAPVFTLSFSRAWADVFGSDAQFSKWRVTITDDFNMKLGGSVNYNFSAGGFISNQKVQLPDWQHFMGNQTIIASPFVKSYQLAPYYANSTGDDFYATGHLEWHLNGLFTNKIPVLRKANIGMVTGGNAFYVDASRNYSEVFVGLENIFKFLRVDFVWGYDGNNRKWVQGIVLGMGGLFSGSGID